MGHLALHQDRPVIVGVRVRRALEARRQLQVAHEGALAGVALDGATAGSGPSFMSGVQTTSLKAVSSGALAVAFATATPAKKDAAVRKPRAAERASGFFLIMSELLF